MRWMVCLFPAFLVSVAAVEITRADEDSTDDSELVRAYSVNKKVIDFAETEDFSTPEGACAAINRLSASGDQTFVRRVSASRFARATPIRTGKRELSEQARYELLNAEILEVRVYRERYACVIARIPPRWKFMIGYQCFELNEGRWLKAGESVHYTVGQARKHFRSACGRYAERPVRPKINAPESYLKPFIEFLQKTGEDPKTLVLKALTERSLVIMGELHHRPWYWEFNASLATDADFSRHVRAIYMELPANDQELIDEFLASKKCDTNLVIETLRDMPWMGWPDQPMLDFFEKVWHVNRSLPAHRRLRIVLVDMERPWKDIERGSDWRRYKVDRNQFMAENILRDMREHPEDDRSGLFIVGAAHAALNLKRGGGEPHKTAGWHLREDLGSDQVYAICPHRCVITNDDRVHGRVCLGIFDSAFSSVDHRPMAFPLDRGPFGQQPFDAHPEPPLWGSYCDAFDAYLYLGPLEDEVFSPLIPGFYTDDFVKELDRRHRTLFNRPLVEGRGLTTLDGKSFTRLMCGSWGKPRRWRTELGPMDAWQLGDGWEDQIRRKKHAHAFEHPEIITNAAKELFVSIQNADYQHHYDGIHWETFLPKGVHYTVHHHFDVWVRWICRTFSENPIQSFNVGDVYKDEIGLPAVDYVVTLRDGTQLKGFLPFEYQPRQQLWTGVQGIDWHLQ